MPAMKSIEQTTGCFQSLCRENGGQLLIQHGHDLSVPQVPPRSYWLLFDHPAQPAQNQIRSAARIEASWGMTLRLAREPEYRRTIDTLSFTYVLNGQGILRDATRQYDVGAGDLLTLFPGIPHVYGPLPGERWDEITVFLDGPVFAAWVQKGLLDPQYPLHRMEPINYWLERFHQVLLPLARNKGEQTPNDWGRMVGLIAEMTSLWQRTVTDPEATWLDRATNCLCGLPEENGQTDWPKMAGVLGVSERTFRRRFKALAGVTPGQYRTHYRMKLARQRLLESDEKVSQTALALGFANEFHFSRRFKQITGISPSAYRELHHNR